jgi:hypothetical protein
MSWFPDSRPSFHSYLSLIALLIIAVHVAGCVMNAEHKNMVPADLPMTPRNQSTVSIQVASEVEHTILKALEFREALESSILNAGVFGQVVATVPAKYSLQVHLNNLELDAAFGFTNQVRLVATWELKRTDTGIAQWKDIIATKHTGTTADAYGAMRRIKLIIEVAARANIRDALIQIRQLNLD